MTGLSPFVFEVIRERLVTATSDYWVRRAEQFDACLPTSGDYPGEGLPAEQSDLERRIRAKAQACRNRAQLCDDVLDDSPAVIAALDVFWAEVFDRLHVLARRSAAVDAIESATTIDELQQIWRDADRGGYLSPSLRSRLTRAAREIEAQAAA